MNKLTTLILILLLSAMAHAQDWPFNNQFIYFGSPVLDQTTSGVNYALLQHKGEGRVLLNSPTTISVRLSNVEKLSLDNSGFTFRTGFNNSGPTVQSHESKVSRTKEKMMNQTCGIREFCSISIK